VNDLICLIACLNKLNGVERSITMEPNPDSNLDNLDNAEEEGFRYMGIWKRGIIYGNET
jgi:hypothetical protein